MKFSQLHGLLLLTFTLFGLSCQSGSHSAKTPPNVIVIMVDDMGFSDISPYGGEIRTPNLQALSDGGVRFTQFYNTGRCAPTRASLLTGLYPHQAGVGEMVEKRDVPGYYGRLTEETVTLAEVLKEQNYQTFMSGKWHVTHYNYEDDDPNIHRDSWPLQRGFDRYFGTISGAGSFYTPKSLLSGNEFITPSEDFYYTDAISDTAVAYIREADPNRPFLIYVAHVAPHWPLHAPEEAITPYQEVYEEGWEVIRENRYQTQLELGLIDSTWAFSEPDSEIPSWSSEPNKEWQARRMAVYAAQVEIMDQGIGRIMEALKEKDQFENTLILFLSDNGGGSEIMQGRERRHGYFPLGGTQPDIMPGGPDTFASYGPEWAHVSNTPLRKYKKFIYEGGIASPLIAHWPSGISDAGAIRQEPAHVIDIMATAVDASGATYPTTYQGNQIKPMAGESLLPVFDGDELDRERLYWEHIGNRAIRDGNWKLVADSGEPWELFDLSTDRSEIHNLAADYPEKVEQMKALWIDWAIKNDVQFESE